MRRFVQCMLALFIVMLLSACGGSHEVNSVASGMTSSSGSAPKKATMAALGFVPENGWWWNVTEQGRGFAIEVQGNSVFMAAFLYETTGQATWYVSTLVQQDDGSFAGALTRYTGGQTLLGAYKSPASSSPVANGVLRFNSAKTATLSLSFSDGSNRSINIERFPILGAGTAITPSNGSFQNGWWWNPAQGGRGFYVEVQGSNVFVGGFMYDATGQPTWYVSYANLVGSSVVSGKLYQYAGGQSLNGNFKTPTQLPDNIGTLTFQFTSPTTANMTLPDGGTVALSRFAFNGSGIDLFGLSGDGNGVWRGDGGGDAGSADGSGAAGDGEYVVANIKFPYLAAPTGTITWTVVRSQYGLTNTTGTLTIQKDTSGKGGYKVIGVNGGGLASVSPKQANFFVALNGQVSGSLPLLINGVVKDTLYTFAQSVKSTAALNDFSEYAGQYGFAYLSVDTGLGTNPWISTGVFQLRANGTGRICDESLFYSDTCANGLDVVASYYDANTRNVLRLTQASVQSRPISYGWATGANIIAVMHKFGTNGMSFIGDFVTTGPGANRTGAQFGARASASPLSPTSVLGAWDSSLTILGQGLYTTKIAVAGVGAAVKSRYGVATNNCAAASYTLTPSIYMNGSLLYSSPGLTDGALIFLDDDVAAYVVPGEAIGFARRYSSRPTDAPCQPF